tara:strand:+ start:440 stop:1633 length:1194 start_codon:yes stop_codon:yes gene_type:complete
MNSEFTTKLPYLVAFLTGHMKNRNDKLNLWAKVKREHDDELCELLGVDAKWGIQAGKLLGFDIDEKRQLVLLNYSPTAHNLLHEVVDGWSDELRLLRGVVYSYETAGQVEGVTLVSRGFEKFFNQGELPETSMENLASMSGDTKLRCTRKEDGHMIEYFIHDGKLCTTTRGRLGTPSAVGALELMELDDFKEAWVACLNKGFDLMSLVCEFVHPMTTVHVDYAGAKQIFLLEAYDADGNPATPEVRDAICEALPEVILPVDVVFMTLQTLHDEINDRSVVNQEGWVAVIPNGDGEGRRVKFKYISYIGEMVKSKLSYKYLMNCIKNDRLDYMLITLPEEIRTTAYEMVDEVLVKLKEGQDTGAKAGWWSLYDLYAPSEGGINNFRNVCRAYYKSQTN